MSSYHLRHITKEGERWDWLAWMYYGDVNKLQVLIAANPDIPIDSTLPSGVELIVPVLQSEEFVQSDELPPWKV